MQHLAFGLDITDRSAELVSLIYKKGAVTVDRVASSDIPPGMIIRGLISDPDGLVAVLSRFLDAEIGPRRSSLPCGVAFPEYVTYCKTFSLPATLDRQTIKKALTIEANDVIPATVTGATSDIIVMDRTETEQNVLYCLVEKEVNDLYAGVLRRVGVRPTFLDGEALAMARALVRPDEKYPVIIVDMGSQSTLVAVWDRGCVRMSSNTPLGGDHLTTAIETQLHLPFEKAEALKRTEGFDPNAHDGRSFLILQKPMADILTDVRATMVYYEKQSGRRIAKMILAGGTSLTPNIREYLETNFPGMAISLADPLRGLSLEYVADPTALKKNAVFLSTAVGLAMRALEYRTAPGVDLTRRIEKKKSAAAAAFEKYFSQAKNALSMPSKPKKPATPNEPAAPTPSEKFSSAVEADQEYAAGLGSVLGSKYPAAAKPDDDDEEMPAAKPPADLFRTGRPMPSRRDRGDGMSPVVTAILVILALVVCGAGITGVVLFAHKNGINASTFGSLFAKNPAPAPQVAAPTQTSPDTVSQVFFAQTAPVTDGNATRNGNPIVTTRVIETDVTAEDSFPATGSVDVTGGKSKGAITVTNTATHAFTFVAKTRFLSKEGILFRLDTSTVIPASGTVTVMVTADQAGPTGDIGPSTFTVPGLSAAQQLLVTGKSDAAMTGGSGKAIAVTADDIAAAHAKLVDKMKADATANFASMVVAGETIVPDLISNKDVLFTTPTAGTVGAMFQAKLTLRFSAMVIPENAVTALLQAKMQSGQPSGSAGYTLGKIAYTVQAYDTAAAQAEVRADAPVNKGP